jgi:hypothetical protein
MQSIVTLLLLAASPDAATAATPAVSEPVKAKPVKEKKICRNIVATGTRLGKRECKTAEEWAAVDDSLNRGRSGARSN